jgi:hypothetical protein
LNVIQDVQGIAVVHVNGKENGKEVSLPTRADYLGWIAQTGLALARCRTVTDALDAMTAQLDAAPFLLRGYVILVEAETLRLSRVASFGRAPTLPAALPLAGSLAGAAIAEERLVVAPPAASFNRCLGTNPGIRIHSGLCAVPRRCITRCHRCRAG